MFTGTILSIMKTSIKIFLRPDNTNIDGSRSLYLLFTSQRQLKKIALNIKVMPKDWNASKTEVKRSDIEFLRKNKHIRKYSDKANKIIDEYFFADKNLSADEFERQFKSNLFGNESFYDFIENELKTLDIAEGTRKDYVKQISKLKSFRKTLDFSEIDYNLLKDYDTHLRIGRDIENNENTRACSMKFIRQVINKATKQGITDVKPFQNFKVKRIEGDREHLEFSELERLEMLLQSDKLNTNKKSVLQYFLFSCYTGLRYGDLQTLKYKDIAPDNIDGKDYFFIVIDMHKTGKPVEIPLANKALKFIDKGLAEKTVFHVFTNQATNRHLKTIMQTAGINKEISFHSARHTFASVASDLGIHPNIIQSVMGHTDIKQTLSYAKTSRRAKVNALKTMDEKH